MDIDEKLISYLEDLSYLTLTDSEKQRLMKDLNNILSGVNRLGELDTNCVIERSHPFDNTNAFREDEQRESFSRELILRNSHTNNGRMIIAPKSLDTASLSDGK